MFRRSHPHTPDASTDGVRSADTGSLFTLYQEQVTCTGFRALDRLPILLGEAQIYLLFIASWDGAMAWPMAQPTPTSQMVLKQPETVGVSAVLVEATPERSDRILSSVSDSVMVMTEEFQLDDGAMAGVADAGILFLADLAGPVTIGVSGLADAVIPFPADPTGTATVEMACHFGRCSGGVPGRCWDTVHGRPC